MGISIDIISFYKCDVMPRRRERRGHGSLAFTAMPGAGGVCRVGCARRHGRAGHGSASA